MRYNILACAKTSGAYPNAPTIVERGRRRDILNREQARLLLAAVGASLVRKLCGFHHGFPVFDI